MQLKRLDELSDKLRKGTIHPDEEQELYAFYDSFDDNSGYTHLLGDGEQDIYRDVLLHKINKRTKKRPVIRRISWQIGAAAAVLLLVLANVFYFTRDTQQAIDLANTYYKPQEIALLTTPDGQTHTLGDKDVPDVMQNGFHLSKRADGYTQIQIDQSGLDGSEANPVQIQVAIGHVYHLALPDGTKIKLEPGSEIYLHPTYATDSRRHVRLRGEAYFDVAHDEQRPFVVETALQQVRVLGTEFSVVAHSERNDEKVALYQGRVKLYAAASDATSILTPGQMAYLDRNNNTYRLESFPTKEGVYTHSWQFKEEPLQLLAANLQRWFDVKVQVDDRIADKTFTGMIPQNMSLKSILDALNQTEQVHYVQQDDTIYIKPNK